MAGEMGTLGEAELCNRCGGENVIWATPSPLWNLVMRGNDINGDPKWGDLVCIRCFVVLAEEAGVRPSRWRLTADPEPEGLIYETPSGRVWDRDRWLWVDPPLSKRVLCGVCGDSFAADQAMVHWGDKHEPGWMLEALMTKEKPAP
jgi:hypothetical protein